MNPPEQELFSHVIAMPAATPAGRPRGGLTSFFIYPGMAIQTAMLHGGPVALTCTDFKIPVISSTGM